MTSGGHSETQCARGGDAIPWTSNWVHITVGIQPQQSCIEICHTPWDATFNAATPKCITNSACTSFTDIDIYTGAEDISIGDDPDANLQNFSGKLVDVRFYPNTKLGSAEA